jgi:RNA polymerase sigma factor (sigma-70 family)
MTTQSEPGDGRLYPALSAIMSERRQLLNLAYRLLGSLAEAEDVVQETYARWYAMSRQQQHAIESPGAWLTKVASRICLDLLGSARARRESYVGEWIPEPLPERTEWINGRSGGTTADPADRVTLDESVNMAFLVVLESMTPPERVAFILHVLRIQPFHGPRAVLQQQLGDAAMLAHVRWPLRVTTTSATGLRAASAPIESERRRYQRHLNRRITSACADRPPAGVPPVEHLPPAT